MSLLSLLAGTTGSIVVPPVDPPAPTTGWPTTTDPVVLAMRPTGRTVTEGRATDDATAATESTRQVNAIQADARPDGFGYWDMAGPDYRTTLFYAPGTYSGSAPSDWRALVGENPSSRSLIAKRDNSGGVVHSFGSLYMENLHLQGLTTTDHFTPKYPWHMTGGQMCIAANCTFDNSAVTSDVTTGDGGIAGWLGADGTSGMTIILYKCNFVAGVRGNGLNIHGPSGAMSKPMTLVFVDCTGLDTVEILAPGILASNGQPSRMYVINTPMAKIGAGPGCYVYTNGTAAAHPGNEGTIVRSTTTWPVPTGGIDTPWSSYYYPSKIGTGTYDSTHTVTDAAPFQPVVGRTYFTRIRLDQAMHVTHAGVYVTTAAGRLGVSTQPATTPYLADEVPNAAAPVTVGANSADAVLGTQAIKQYNAYSRYPGDNGIWVKCAFSSSSVRVSGSSQIAGMTDCAYSDDGTTLVPVTAGTPHPRMFIRST